MSARPAQFPYLVKSVGELPEQFRALALRKLETGDRIGSILMIPPQTLQKSWGGGGARLAPQQALLSTTRGVLHLYGDDSPLATYLPADHLVFVNHTLILLYGRLELVGDANGARTSIVVEYNTVGHRLLEPILADFLRRARGAPLSPEIGDGQNETLLEQLRSESFKFSSGLRYYALQPGERLLGFAFQPRMEKSLLGVFRIPIAPASLLALSDQSVILIEEDRATGASYGFLVSLWLGKTIATVDIDARGRLSIVRIVPRAQWPDLARHITVSERAGVACARLWSVHEGRKDV